MNPLLRNIPKGIKVKLNPAVWGWSRGHALIINVLGGLLSFLTFQICLSKFPLTLFNSKQIDYECVPDYGTGNIVTYSRQKLRYVDYI